MKTTYVTTKTALKTRTQHAGDHEYRFRAECMHDVWEFLKKAADHARAGENTGLTRWEIRCDLACGGGCNVAFWSQHGEGARFRRVLQDILDGHVMVETLALAKHYTGQRAVSDSVQALRLRKDACTSRIEHALAKEERRIAGLSEKRYRGWLKAGHITPNPEFNEIFECAGRLGVQLDWPERNASD